MQMPAVQQGAKWALLAIILSFFGAVYTVKRAEAATQPIHLTTKLEQAHPWQLGLTVRFIPDEALCKKQYGDNWKSVCSPELSEYGTLVQGVTIQPAVRGQWRWGNGGQLQFRPDEPLSPNTRYTVNLKNMTLPGGVNVAPKILNLTTWPQAVLTDKEHVWIDPSPRSAHAVSINVTFLYPVDDNTMAQAVTLQSADPSSGLRFAPPERVWNHDKTVCSLNARVESLPDDRVQARLNVRGVSGFVMEKGKIRLLKNDKSPDFTYGFSMLGKNQLLQISKLELVEASNEELEKEYRLLVTTSLHVRPDDVAKALRLVQLPRTNSPEAGRAYDWSQAPGISPADFSRGVPLKAERVQAGNEPTSKMQFRVRAAADSYVFASLPTSLTTPSGIGLGKPVQAVLRAKPHTAELTFLQPGHVLALGGEQKLDLYSTGLTAIKWRVAQVRDPFLALLAAYDSSFDQGPTLDMNSLSEMASGELPLTKGEAGSAQFTALDLRPLLQTRENIPPGNAKRGLMEVTLIGMNNTEEVAHTSRFLLVTNMGLMVKKEADGTREAFVSSLLTGDPVPSVTVHILGANGLPVATARTNDQGRASLPSVQGLSLEKRPVAVVAFTQGATENDAADMAWASLDDESRKVYYSTFGVGGRTRAEEGLNAYVFSQRGMFRPGERLLFGAVIKHANWATLPPDLPLKAVLMNPAGTEVMSQMFTVGRDGLCELHWDSPVSAATGLYRLDIRLVSANGEQQGRSQAGTTQLLGTTSVLIEEFQQDTLALQARFQPEEAEGWLSLSAGKTESGVPASKVSLQSHITLTNLHGLPAAGHRVRAKLEVLPALLRCNGYEDFKFYDAAPYRGVLTQTELPDLLTDEQGKAILNVPLDTLLQGSMRFFVLLEGFEAAGGRAVGLEQSILVSPLQWIVGYRSGGSATNLKFIPQGQTGHIDFVALDPHLQRITSEELTFTLSERRYVTSLVNDESGRYRYDEVPVDTELTRSTHRVEAEKFLRWPIPTETPGDFLLTVRNSAKKVVALVPFTVAGTALRTANDLPSGALRARLDKNEYAGGETIQVFLSVPYDGSGLITLEREGVAAHKWFKAKAGDSVHSLVLPKEFEGRGYVNVSFVRAFDSPNIYMQPYSYAIAPFTANIAQRDMDLRLEVAERAQPGDTMRVKLHAKQPGKALVFAVDEGVLQLNHFTTPSPLDYLLLDQALQVETMQIFDLIMPDHARLKGRIPGFGGGMAIAQGRFVNPFKRKAEPPLATWRLIDVTAGENTVSFTIPDYYNGKVRIMAVGSSPETTGSAETSLLVQAPLIITPQVPLTLAPHDAFEGAVVLYNAHGQGTRTVRLRVDGGPALRLASTEAVDVVIPDGGSIVHAFSAEALDILGENTIRFVAEYGEAATRRTMVREVSLSIRPPTALRSTQQAGVTLESMDIPVSRSVYPYAAQSLASISALPLPAVRGLVRYLDAYPYDCTEQLLSKALPYVVLSRRPDLLADATRPPEKVREQAEAVIASALQALQNNLRRGQGVAMWPRSEVSDELTVYAGDFILAMREAGRAVPTRLADTVFDSLEEMVLRTPATLEQARIQAYGVWVLTREGRITTQAVEQLRKELQRSMPGWEKDVTASLLAGACALMRMDAQANTLIKGYTLQDATFTAEGIMTPLAAQALHVSVLAKHFPEKLKAKSGASNHTQSEAMVDSVLNALRGQRFASFSSALSVRALMSLSAAQQPVIEGLTLTCTEGGSQQGQQAEVTAISLLTLNAPECTSYRLNIPAKNKTPVYWQVSTEGFDRTVPVEAEAQGMEIQREYSTTAGVPVNMNTNNTIALGDTLTVILKARMHGTSSASAVLVDVLPGGFEMVLPQEGEGLIPATQKRKQASFVRAERREDRMLVFTDLNADEFTYSYTIRAVNKGRFTLPPAQGEAMYDQLIHAHSAGGTVVVY